MAKDVEIYLFIYLFTGHFYLCDKYLFSSFGHLLIWLHVFLVLSIKVYLYILNAYLLSDG